MPSFSLTAEAMRQSAKTINEEALNYENASKVAMAAADELAAGWEGDAQKTFVAEQEKAKQWYLKMSEIARQYATFLTTAAANYEAADQQSASDIAAH